MGRRAAWAIISIFISSVLPVSWLVKSFILLCVSVSIVYLFISDDNIKNRFAKYKYRFEISKFILVALLVFCDSYIIHDQYIKDHPPELKRNFSVSLVNSYTRFPFAYKGVNDVVYIIDILLYV